MEKSMAHRALFGNDRETASQESLLRLRDFGYKWDHTDSDPSAGVAPPLPRPSASQFGVSVPSEQMEVDLDQTVKSVSDEQNAATVDVEQAAEDPTVRVVPQKRNSANAVDLGETATDPTVHVVLKKHKTVTMATEAIQGSTIDEEDGSRVLKKPKGLSVSPSFSDNSNDERLNSPAKDNGKKKLKIPLREVVKAIAMNSRNLSNTEEDKKIEDEKMSYMQILMRKGIEFPGM